VRWIGHLLGAAFAGVLAVIILEQSSNVSVSQMATEIFAEFNIGSGLMIAILFLIALAIWAKSSSG